MSLGGHGGGGMDGMYSELPARRMPGADKAKPRLPQGPLLCQAIRLQEVRTGSSTSKRLITDLCGIVEQSGSQPGSNRVRHPDVGGLLLNGVTYRS